MAGLVSTNTLWSLWLFVHLILAVGLLGALTAGSDSEGA